MSNVVLRIQRVSHRNGGMIVILSESASIDISLSESSVNRGCQSSRISDGDCLTPCGPPPQGGSILVCSAAGGEVRAGSNLNLLLEECGVSVLPDCLLAGAGQKAASQGALLGIACVSRVGRVLGVDVYSSNG